MWWFNPLISELEKQKEEGNEFQASLGFRERSTFPKNKQTITR
jgi:hypothetical protein